MAKSKQKTSNLNEKFPKNFDYKDLEEEIYESWEKAGYFNPDNHPQKDAPTYSIILPPPNANGSLHVGHAMYVIEDILCRWKRLKGFKVLWLPGADHAGFETQYVYENVLREKGKTRFDFTTKELYEDIMKFVQDQRFTIYDQMKKLGFSLDWTREKFTLNEDLVEKVYDTFMKMHESELLYRDNYLANYSPYFGSTFSDLEVKHIEKKSPLYYIKYGPLVVATVRPETIFGDVAIAVNPSDKRYKQYIGQTLEVEIPEMTLKLKVIADKQVDMKFGTGALKITPAHDHNDFQIARDHKLPLVQVIGLDGKLNERTGKYADLTVKEARKAVVGDLERMGLIEKIDENYINSVAVTYKDDMPIEPMLMPNWFIKMDSLAKRAIDAVKEGRTKIHPKFKVKTYYNWLKNIRDWPVSRQIVWGIRIPAWYNVDENPETLVVFLDKKGEQVSGQVERLLDQGYTLEEISSGLQSLAAPNDAKFVVSKKSPGDRYLQETDTLDTWYSSGQWPLTTLGFPDGKDFKEFFPTDTLDTAEDILFFWVARMIMLSLYLTDEVPFRDVYLHSMVVDGKGKKMSKSKGNVINPLDVIPEFGADSLRYALIAGTSAAGKVSVSTEKINGYKKFINKIWNAARFIIMNYERLDEELKTKVQEKVLKADFSAENSRLKETLEVEKNLDKKLEKFRFGIAAELLYSNFWTIFCDKWIEETKDKINSEKASEEEKIESLSELIYILTRYLRMLHPFIPFITEKIWQILREYEFVAEESITFSK